jgi:UDP:flavonoid glycosyltransferase YjiC (YdhE family)
MQPTDLHLDSAATRLNHPAVPLASSTERSTTTRRRRIVLTTVGSLGDLHPYLAIALGLQAHGHEAILATGECYRRKIEALGIGFRPVRPDCDWVTDSQVMRRFMNLRLGMARLALALLPALPETYADTLAAVEGADLLVSQIPLAARLVAEKTGLAWASTIHLPLFFFSGHDPSILPVAPLLSRHLRGLGPAFWGRVVQLGKWGSRFLGKPWYRLRADLGLPPATDLNPLLDSHSPALVLALFSKCLAQKQPDWPPQSVVTGFPLYDQDGEAGLPPELLRFLDAGPPPLVFTLGTAVCVDPGPFFEHSATVAKLLGRRAVLVLKDPRNRPRTLPEGVMAVDYAPFSELFPRAAAIVHHGGIGTTGLAMRSGRPMLVMPRAWDQPDNAERVVRLGIARTIARHRYTPARIAAELRPLLDHPSYARRAAAIGEEVRKEDGVKTACDALEMLLEGSLTAPASRPTLSPRARHPSSPPAGHPS